MNDAYWFTAWLKQHRAKDSASLRRVLDRARNVDALITAAPDPRVSVRDEPSDFLELTGGKGVDLTGELGCHHIDCLAKEIHGLFRHAWHYFDRIILPDQALFAVVEFQGHRDIRRLIDRLSPFVQVLTLIEKTGGGDLVRFETRAPSCRQHFEQHAREAEVDQAFTNTVSLIEEIAHSARMSWTPGTVDTHIHLEFRLDHDAFEHSEWGAICSLATPIPEDKATIRKAITTNVVQKYLAGLSADALASRRARAPLGATIPFYRRLLATHPAPTVESVAFELALPISPDIPVRSLVKLRRTEGYSFERFQAALRAAITERLKTASSANAEGYAREIKRDLIDPELRQIRDKLAASRTLAARGASAGIGLGVVAATVGLFTPLSTNPIGAGLAVGGAITLGASSIKKAVDEHLTVKRDVSLSDMYFLWKAHKH